MEILAISLARAVAFIEIQTLDPFGKHNNLEAVQRLAKEFSFGAYPEKFADIDFQKGIELMGGRLGDIAIDKMSIYYNGVMVDTRSSTDDAERVIHHLLEIARNLFGAAVRPERVYFVSQLIFRSDISLALINPVLQRAADRIAGSVSADMKHHYNYETSGVIINADLSQNKIAPGLFSIERRSEQPYAEKIYFSNAPLRTKEHIALVEELEASLSPHA